MCRKIIHEKNRKYFKSTSFFFFFYLFRKTSACIVHGRYRKASSALTASTVFSATTSGLSGGKSCGNLRKIRCDFETKYTFSHHGCFQFYLLTWLSCPGTSLCWCGKEARWCSWRRDSPAHPVSGSPWRPAMRPWRCSSLWLQGLETGTGLS